MTKNWQRHAREWPQHGDIDCDYATGRQLTGEWKPMECREPKDRYNKPLVGGPQLLVNQWDKVLDCVDCNDSRIIDLLERILEELESLRLSIEFTSEDNAND
jgi:hypothetical protein